MSVYIAWNNKSLSSWMLVLWWALEFKPIQVQWDKVAGQVVVCLSENADFGAVYMEPLEVANKNWNFLIASSQSWDGCLHRVELTPKIISHTIVHEGFRHKWNYFLFCWIFEKLIITCAQIFIIFIKFKNLQVFNCQVWTGNLKVQEFKTDTI